MLLKTTKKCTKALRFTTFVVKIGQTTSFAENLNEIGL